MRAAAIDSLKNMLLIAPVALVLVAASCNDSAGMRRLLVEAERHNQQMHTRSIEDRATIHAMQNEIARRLDALERKADRLSGGPN